MKPILTSIVSQHAEEAGYLYATRSALTAAAHASLDVLSRFDDRLAAHLDGLAVAGPDAWPICVAALDDASVGALFAAAVVAIEAGRRDRVDELCERAETSESRLALISAFEWARSETANDVLAGMWASADSPRRDIAVGAALARRVAAAPVLEKVIADSDSKVRARGLRGLGECGGQLEAGRMAARSDSDPHCRLWAAWSSVLQGERGAALETLTSLITTIPESLDQWVTLAVCLQARDMESANSVLREIAAHPEHLRVAIMGSGIAGNVSYVPWLLNQMRDVGRARISAEAFANISGVDLWKGFDQPQPASADDDMAGVGEVGADDARAWPDHEKIDSWWLRNERRFDGGLRYFVGAPVTWRGCVDVLKNGYQRQRILAAHHLCLLRPGTPLFNTSAPAWRQQRLLAQMT